jgi:hypothetical protein
LGCFHGGVNYGCIIIIFIVIIIIITGLQMGCEPGGSVFSGSVAAVGLCTV